MFLKELIQLVKPETTKIILTDKNQLKIAEFYPAVPEEVRMCFDYEVREISPLTNSWFVVSLNVTKGELPQKIEPGADPEDYHSSQLKEFLMDGGVPESDIQTVNKRIRLPATKWNKKLLDKWYCYHRNVTVYQIEIDPRTRLPIFEILY